MNLKKILMGSGAAIIAATLTASAAPTIGPTVNGCHVSAAPAGSPEDPAVTRLVCSHEDHIRELQALIDSTQ